MRILGFLLVLVLLGVLSLGDVVVIVKVWAVAMVVLFVGVLVVRGSR
jgi:hypothetical protein